MRAAFFVQVILVILIAAVSLTGRSGFAQFAAQGAVPAATQGSAPAAAKGATDECLAKPGAMAPQGSHWYYRVNRADGRHCWYLGAEGAKVRARAREAEQQRAPSPSCFRRRRARRACCCPNDRRGDEIGGGRCIFRNQR
jgi:hypothetical protein